MRGRGGSDAEKLCLVHTVQSQRRFVLSVMDDQMEKDEGEVPIVPVGKSRVAVSYDFLGSCVLLLFRSFRSTGLKAKWREQKGNPVNLMHTNANPERAITNVFSQLQLTSVH